jgi:heme/copper-type cytochrome/quinol oxidase subunit 4
MAHLRLEGSDTWLSGSAKTNVTFVSKILQSLPQLVQFLHIISLQQPRVAAVAFHVAILVLPVLLR